MSYDLLVFEPGSVPLRRDALLAWYEAATQWNDLPSASEFEAMPRLKAWYDEMVRSFPPLSGAGDDVEETHLTDYSIGRHFIYLGFAWSVANEAFLATRTSAESHQLGFFNVSSSVAEVYLPNRAGRLRPRHADVGGDARYRYAIWKRSDIAKTAMLEACYGAIQRNESHEAMAPFAVHELNEHIRAEFELDSETSASVAETEVWSSEGASWLAVTCNPVLKQEVSASILPLALERRLMLYDPQVGGVWGNRRPEGMSKKRRS